MSRNLAFLIWKPSSCILGHHYIDTSLWFHIGSTCRPGWAGLGWAGLGWAGLGWAGLGWAGLGWAGLGWAGLGWAGLG